MILIIDQTEFRMVHKQNNVKHIPLNLKGNQNEVHSKVQIDKI